MGDRLGIHGVVDILPVYIDHATDHGSRPEGGDKNIFEVSIKLNISFLNVKT